MTTTSTNDRSADLGRFQDEADLCARVFTATLDRLHIPQSHRDSLYATFARVRTASYMEGVAAMREANRTPKIVGGA